MEEGKTKSKRERSWTKLPRADWTLQFRGSVHAVHTFPFMTGPGESEMLKRSFLSGFDAAPVTRLDEVLDLPAACHRLPVIEAFFDFVYDQRQWEDSDWRLLIPLLRLGKVAVLSHEQSFHRRLMHLSGGCSF